MHITLRAGEKIYLNGAVLRADRKVCLELLNDATFLLEAHVMSVERAITPLRQLYFIVQMMVMSPGDIVEAQRLFHANLAGMLATYEDRAIIAGLKETEKLVGTGHYFESLKVLRGMFACDDALMARERLALAS